MGRRNRENAQGLFWSSLLKTISISLLQEDLSYTFLPSVWEVAFPRTCLGAQKGIFSVLSSKDKFLYFLFKNIYF